MSDWKTLVGEEWRKRQAAKPVNRNYFPLIEQTFDPDEIISVMDVVMSGQLTMSENVKEFERQFASYVGAPYAVMVNSGSSANLLAMAVAANPVRKKHFNNGDEVLVPSVCWSTSVWPIFQMGLKPIFVDVDPQTLNADLEDVKRKTTSKTRGMVVVHILGNSAPMTELFDFVREHDLIVLEDTCESLGSRYQGKNLGAFGDFGSYSFYFSHHITTGEGGMVVCRTPEDYDLLKCLRAHGWSRELSNRREIEEANSDVDPRFLFVNVGYNVRPMEVQAALGICQMRKIDKMNENRVSNRAALIERLGKHPKWKKQFEFTTAAEGTTPVWFGFCCLLRDDLSGHHKRFLRYLSENGVENRPIVSGNFVRQPALKQFGLNLVPEDFKGAEAVHNRGFFIGLHTTQLTGAQLDRLSDIMLAYPF
jgi:CDP-6-deoxy-D-xylo-4-hexulose-3-dehydrase